MYLALMKNTEIQSYGCDSVVQTIFGKSEALGCWFQAKSNTKPRACCLPKGLYRHEVASRYPHLKQAHNVNFSQMVLCSHLEKHCGGLFSGSSCLCKGLHLFTSHSPSTSQFFLLFCPVPYLPSWRYHWTYTKWTLWVSLYRISWVVTHSERQVRLLYVT